jgi:outer membrane protein assembly factor BamD (BamD/ComL family)
MWRMNRFLIITTVAITSACLAAAGTNTVETAAFSYHGTAKEVKGLIQRAEAALQQGQFDQATNHYKEIENFFPSEYATESAVRIGDILLLQGKTNLAITAYQDAMKKYHRAALLCGGKLKRLKAEQNPRSDGIGTNAPNHQP